MMETNSTNPRGTKGHIFSKSKKMVLCGFSKWTTKAQEMVHAYGGVIVSADEVMGMRHNELAQEEFIVIASEPMVFRRRAYLVALVMGYPILHFDWILMSIRAHKELAYDGFQLPSGFSIEEQRYIYRRSRNRNDNLLRGVTIGFVQDRENIFFDKTLSKAASLGGAQVVQVTNSQAMENIDVLVSRCDTKLSNAAKGRSIPVLNQDWIFECFVTQSTADQTRAEYHGPKAPFSVGHAFRRRDPHPDGFYRVVSLEPDRVTLETLRRAGKAFEFKDWRKSRKLSPTGETQIVNVRQLKEEYTPIIVLSEDDFNSSGLMDAVIFYL